MTLTSRDYLNDPLFLGFDRLFNRLDTFDIANRSRSNYPPYNVHRSGEDSYVIELAVAGFDSSDINISVHEHKLTVEGKREETNVEEDTQKYTCIHRGIAKRNFKLSWNLADTVVVKDAEMHNGVLAVYLENEVPEEKKPKMIPISNGEGFVNNLKKKLLTE